ncbi:hypothetical protein TA3x_000299 [Tundrisphaera sp. TA3]|uniref:hypothetical protein n=1 Tax=Tundrisphaera sp. TA3 TaxID=3435775 RepID=UPI003EBA76B2
MLTAWHTTLTATLGLGLAALASVCFILWRRIHALSAIVERPARAEPVIIPIEPPFAPTPIVPASLVVVPAPSRPSGPRAGFRADPAEVAEAGPTLIAVPRLEITKPPAASDMDRRFADVWALADAGTPAATIAGHTGYPIGQVELILGLRRRLPATAGAATDG